MAIEVYIPKFGQTVEEVKLLQWLVEDGAAVKKGQELLEIETDKTTFFVEAEGAGTLHRGPYQVDQTIPVLTVVAIIGAADETFMAEAKAEVKEAEAEVKAEAEISSTLASTSTLTSKPFVSPRARKLAAGKGVDVVKAGIVPTGGEGVRIAERDVLAYLAAAPKATPVAQKVAAESGVDLRNVTGTGPGGKITKGDVEQMVRPGAAAAQPAPAAPPLPSTPAPLPTAEVSERIPLKGVRGIIADRMGASVHTTARVTLMLEADATEFVAARERIKARVADEWGYAPGYNDLLAKIAAAGLRKFPYMNARLAADAIELLAHVNIGMAVDTERGLLVPVIRDADAKSLRQFGAEFRALVDRARKGRSLPDDITGGTFTITNLGMYDIEAFTPVINLPEAAILGVGKILPKWVFRPESPDKPVLRQMLALSLVFDHRIIDGAPAAQFLQYVKQVVEEPYLLLAE